MAESNKDWRYKYLKYKNKYQQLKQLQWGGGESDDESVPSRWDASSQDEATAAAREAERLEAERRARRAAELRARRERAQQDAQRKRQGWYTCPRCHRFGIPGLKNKTCKHCGHKPLPCQGVTYSGFHHQEERPCKRFAEFGDGYCWPHHRNSGRRIRTDRVQGDEDINQRFQDRDSD